jgi:hypothetical protein
MCARSTPVILKVNAKQTSWKACLNNMESESNFYVQAFYRGGMNSFEVIPNEGHFGVAYDGKLIAELQHNEAWEQTSGENLDEDVFATIVQAIESKYE